MKLKVGNIYTTNKILVCDKRAAVLILSIVDNFTTFYIVELNDCSRKDVEKNLRKQIETHTIKRNLFQMYSNNFLTSMFDGYLGTINEKLLNDLKDYQIYE